MSKNERVAAEFFTEEGWAVHRIKEGETRTPDFQLTDVRTGSKIRVEVKTPEEFPGKSVNNATIRNQVTQSLAKGGQANHIFIDARNTSLTAEEAMLAFRKVGGLPRVRESERLTSLRIKGKNFDISTTYPYRR